MTRRGWTIDSLVLIFSFIIIAQLLSLPDALAPKSDEADPTPTVEGHDGA